MRNFNRITSEIRRRRRRSREKGNFLRNTGAVSIKDKDSETSSQYGIFDRRRRGSRGLGERGGGAGFRKTSRGEERGFEDQKRESRPGVEVIDVFQHQTEALPRRADRATGRSPFGVLGGEGDLDETPERLERQDAGSKDLFLEFVPGGQIERSGEEIKIEHGSRRPQEYQNRDQEKSRTRYKPKLKNYRAQLNKKIEEEQNTFPPKNLFEEIQINPKNDLQHLKRAQNAQNGPENEVHDRSKESVDGGEESLRGQNPAPVMNQDLNSEVRSPERSKNIQIYDLIETKNNKPKHPKNPILDYPEDFNSTPESSIPSGLPQDLEKLRLAKIKTSKLESKTGTNKSKNGHSGDQNPEIYIGSVKENDLEGNRSSSNEFQPWRGLESNKKSTGTVVIHNIVETPFSPSKDNEDLWSKKPRVSDLNEQLRAIRNPFSSSVMLDAQEELKNSKKGHFEAKEAKKGQNDGGVHDIKISLRHQPNLMGAHQLVGFDSAERIGIHSFEENNDFLKLGESGKNPFNEASTDKNGNNNTKEGPQVNPNTHLQPHIVVTSLKPSPGTKKKFKLEMDSKSPESIKKQKTMNLLSSRQPKIGFSSVMNLDNGHLTKTPSSKNQTIERDLQASPEKKTTTNSKLFKSTPSYQYTSENVSKSVNKRSLRASGGYQVTPEAMSESLANQLGFHPEAVRSNRVSGMVRVGSEKQPNLSKPGLGKADREYSEGVESSGVNNGGLLDSIVSPNLHFRNMSKDLKIDTKSSQNSLMKQQNGPVGQGLYGSSRFRVGNDQIFDPKKIEKFGLENSEKLLESEQEIAFESQRRHKTHQIKSPPFSFREKDVRSSQRKLFTDSSKDFKKAMEYPSDSSSDLTSQDPPQKYPQTQNHPFGQDSQNQEKLTDSRLNELKNEYGDLPGSSEQHNLSDYIQSDTVLTAKITPDKTDRSIEFEETPTHNSKPRIFGVYETSHPTDPTSKDDFLNNSSKLSDDMKLIMDPKTQLQAIESLSDLRDLRKNDQNSNSDKKRNFFFDREPEYDLGPEVETPSFGVNHRPLLVQGDGRGNDGRNLNTIWEIDSSHVDSANQGTQGQSGAGGGGGVKKRFQQSTGDNATIYAKHFERRRRSRGARRRDVVLDGGEKTGGQESHHTEKG